MENPERPEKVNRDLKELQENLIQLGEKILAIFHQVSLLLEKIK